MEYCFQIQLLAMGLKSYMNSLLENLNESATMQFSIVSDIGNEAVVEVSTIAPKNAAPRFVAVDWEKCRQHDGSLIAQLSVLYNVYSMH